MKKLLFAFFTTLSLSLPAQETIWHSADNLPLLGKAIDDSSAALRYQRLPDSLQNIVKRDGLFYLGKHSAGMALRFASDSPFISVKWHSIFKALMNHQTPTGTRGLDLYTLMPDGTWTFVNSARPDVNSHNTSARVI